MCGMYSFDSTKVETNLKQTNFLFFKPVTFNCLVVAAY